ncbi:hypothetical protein EKE94_10010 [Mesobaculum littorinae]|uniref:Lipoprotein n=1 Tax=Mesobaculum littorinae TaxID=2486419 RepID=A0A438AGH7_9RHOB|nr:hypothetical protein [Mesobaculum littorinae]RVV97809.1 hypothetical protein EKE94_10010 [Mesobaculum littorinae]
MLRWLCLGGALMTVVACTQAEVTTPPVAIQPKAPGAVGIDVYARDRAAGNPVPRFRGQETLIVRTTGKTAGGGFGELTGVPCTLDSGLYTASLRTPANVNVPDYGPNSPALFIRCVHPDGRSGSTTINTFNVTARERGNAAAGTGLLGAIVIGAVNAANTNPEKDEFKYPAVTIPLK